MKRKTLKNQVYDYLKEQIIIGVYKPGERLVEEKISTELNVSRSPIREAIQMLEKDGLLNVKKQGGVTVIQPSIDDYQYLYECRKELESLAAFLAAQRRTALQLEQIRNAYLKMGKISTQDDLKNVYEANRCFHQSIVEASDNPFLIKMLAQLNGVNSFYRKAILETEPMHMETVIDDHQKIFQAIVEKDSVKAKNLFIQHIENDYKTFIDIFTNL